MSFFKKIVLNFFILVFFIIMIYFNCTTPVEDEKKKSTDVPWVSGVSGENTDYRLKLVFGNGDQ